MKKVLGWLLIVIFLLSGCLPAAPASGAVAEPVQGKKLLPVQVSITPEILSQTDVRLTAKVTASTELTGFALKWNVPGGITILEGAQVADQIPPRDETREYVLVVRKASPDLVKISVDIQYQAYGTTGAAADEVYLGQDAQSALRIVPLREALGSRALPTLNAEPAAGTQVAPPLPPGASSGMIDTDTPDDDGEKITPQSSSVLITITGKLFYPDFPVSSVAVSNTYNSEPIRGATIKAKKGLFFVTTAATSSTTYDGIDDGHFSLAFYGKVGDHVRIEVQAKNKHVTVDNFFNKPWTIAAWEDLVITSPTMDLGDHTLWDDNWSNDKKEEMGVFNVLDVASSGMDLLGEVTSLGKRNLHFKWFIGNNDGTAYTGGTDKINLQGKTDDSDHWDDAIILHEMGHWVQAKFAASVPNAAGAHGDCVYSRSTPNTIFFWPRPGLAYSEGWATFFSMAVREDLGTFQYDWYLDSIGWIGRGGSGEDYQSTNLAGDAYIDHDTGLGNWCDYQVSAALLDVLDSDQDDNDTLDRTFADIFAAFRSKVNGHYPYNINEWWYGWTNSAAGRGINADTFGDEQKIFENFFDDHGIKLGVLFETSSKDAANNGKMNPHLWTPYPYQHIGKLNPGDQANDPYAIYVPGQNTIWISSPQRNVYHFGVSGLFDMAASQGVVTLYDASKVDDWYLNNGVAPGRKCEASGLWTLLPSNRSKVWWYALDYTPVNGKLSCRNRVQDTIIHTPYDPSGIVTGNIIDATNQPLADTVSVCVKGTQNCTTTNTGQYTLTGVPSGKVKITASSESYMSLTQEVLVAPEETTTLNFELSPTLDPGEWRIVLTWYATPVDIDAHLWVPVTATTKQEVYYSRRGSCTSLPYACLDVDDRDGYGPETITITQRFSRTYTYEVYNWSAEAPLAGSGARVRVYNSNGLVKDLLVPNNGSGRWWRVFEISSSGGVIVRNTLSDVSGMSVGEVYPDK